MRHAWVFVLCLYGCTHRAAPDTPHYFFYIPEPANDPCRNIIMPASIPASITVCGWTQL